MANAVAPARAYMEVWGPNRQWGPGAIGAKLAIFSNWKYIILKEFVTIFAKLEKN